MSITQTTNVEEIEDLHRRLDEVCKALAELRHLLDGEGRAIAEEALAKASKRQAGENTPDEPGETPDETPRAEPTLIQRDVRWTPRPPGRRVTPIPRTTYCYE